MHGERADGGGFTGGSAPLHQQVAADGRSACDIPCETAPVYGAGRTIGRNAVLHRLTRQWTDRRTLRSGQPAAARQAGAIPYTMVKGQPAFLLVTSRGTGRWIYPKGAPIEGLEPWQVAAREAYEEAGIEGEVETRPIGSYRTVKRSGLTRSVIEVDLYPLRMVRQLDDWPEKGQRHRHWVILPDARRLLSDPGLVEATAILARRLAGPRQAEAAAITR